MQLECSEIAPVGFLIKGRSGEELGGAFEKLIGVLIAAGTESVLERTADVGDIVVEKPDDMEQVNADLNIRETAFGEENEAAVHATAEEADAPAFLEGIVHEIAAMESFMEGCAK